MAAIESFNICTLGRPNVRRMAVCGENLTNCLINLIITCLCTGYKYRNTKLIGLGI